MAFGLGSLGIDGFTRRHTCVWVRIALHLEKRYRVAVLHALDRELGFGIYFLCNGYAEVMASDFGL